MESVVYNTTVYFFCIILVRQPDNQGKGSKGVEGNIWEKGIIVNFVFGVGF